VLDLLRDAQRTIDDLIDVMGRATIEAVLGMSAETIVGSKQHGKKSSCDIVYHGTRRGCVALKHRQLNVEKPGSGAGTPRRVNHRSSRSPPTRRCAGIAA
jgi:hypothetical protein